MLKRLWLLVSTLWAVVMLTLIFTGGDDEYAIGPLLLAFAPFWLGYLLLLGVRFVYHGSVRPVWQRRHF